MAKPLKDVSGGESFPLAKRALKRFCCPVVFIGIFCLAGTVPAEEAKNQLTLEEAVQAALKQNPAVTQSKERMQAAKEQIGVSRAGYFPQVRFTGDYFYGNAFSRGRAGEVSITAPGTVSIPTSLERKATDFFIYRFSANQLLYDFGRTSGQVAQSRAGYKQAGEDYANTRQQVVLDTRSRYFEYLASQRAIKVAEENVRQNQELLKQAKGFYKVGLRAKIDVTKAEANLANAEAELIRAKNLADVSRVALMTVLGLKTWPYKDVQDILEVTPKEMSLEDLKKRALSQRPEIRQNLYQQEADKAGIKVARAGYFPTFSSTAAYGWQGNEHPLNDDWWVGAGMTFPLFEGLSTYHSVRQARAQLRSSEASGDSLALAVIREVEQSYLDVKSAWEVIKARIKAKESAAENLRLAWGRYRAGVGDIIEVTDAQVQFAQADLDLVRALFNYRVFEAQLDKAIGKSF
ncbi:MAG: TolC family protein [Deltaproteobacteria bacterium]|nr:TolC family protein [Deltaproteobacteria bacterium]